MFEKAPAGVNTWQCTELAARWFYVDTGLAPPLAGVGENVAIQYHNKYGQFTAYPDSGGTATYSSTIQAGDIISMSGTKGTDPAGHVAVVTRVNVKNGTGTISVIEENGAANGNSVITVTNGQMSYGTQGSYV